MASCISTWSFGLQSVNVVKDVCLSGKCALDAITSSIAYVEENPDNGVYVVGRSGYPNSSGNVECDAAIMHGKALEFGAVMALQRISKPILVAEKVLKVSPHNILVGEGALEFAIDQGFRIEELPPKVQVDQLPNESQHKMDTLGVIVLDTNGDIAAGVSTSGAPEKHPGRVGDSPLPGGGLYANNLTGAACATGDGDKILPFCPTHEVSHHLAQGFPPDVACEMVIQNIADRIGQENMFEIGLIAMNMKGEYGAAGSVKEWTDPLTKEHYAGFPYAVWNEKFTKVPCIKEAPCCI